MILPRILKAMKSITVFCGSSQGLDPAYMKLAFNLGAYLADSQITVIYGGAKIGLMGAVADGALSKNGTVIGVIPDFLKTKEVAHEGLTELIVVGSMHIRKLKMAELCDGVIALPGGFGTMEEYFEMLTWGQLGLHKKPIALLNTYNFYDPLIELADSMVRAGFLKQGNRDLMISTSEIPVLIEMMRSYNPPNITKWLKTGEQ